MPFSISTSVTCYLLPEDGATARATFLGHLQDPNEMWIIAYSFTLEPMIDDIIKNNAPDAPIHVYLDYSQSTGHAEAPHVEKLVKAGVEVTVGTSPVGTKYICHTKGIVCDDTPQPWCWEGSVNFSESGWSQVNTALVFHSSVYRDAFVNQFEHLRYFAWTQERDKQVMPDPPAGALTPPADVPTSMMPATTSGNGSHGGSRKKNGGKKTSRKKTSMKKNGGRKKGSR